jgi:hypothetical protein
MLLVGLIIWTQAEVQWMIWEADDDLDGALSWIEFRAAYVRAARDRLALEPNQLYQLVLFLLCDADGSQSVSGNPPDRIALHRSSA